MLFFHKIFIIDVVLLLNKYWFGRFLSFCGSELSKISFFIIKTDTKCKLDRMSV